MTGDVSIAGCIDTIIIIFFYHFLIFSAQVHVHSGTGKDELRGATQFKSGGVFFHSDRERKGGRTLGPLQHGSVAAVVKPRPLFLHPVSLSSEERLSYERILRLHE